MFCAGWVHRDISDGNILAVWDKETQAWRVRISDLEYAREFPRDDGVAGSDPKTVSPSTDLFLLLSDYKDHRVPPFSWRTKFRPMHLSMIRRNLKPNRWVT